MHLRGICHRHHRVRARNAQQHERIDILGRDKINKALAHAWVWSRNSQDENTSTRCNWDTPRGKHHRLEKNTTRPNCRKTRNPRTFAMLIANPTRLHARYYNNQTPMDVKPATCQNEITNDMGRGAISESFFCNSKYREGQRLRRILIA